MSTLRKIRGAIVDGLPFSLRKPLIYKYRLKVPYYRALQNLTLEAARKQSQISVLFVVSSLSMWKYEEIFDILSNDNRFNVNVVLYPYKSYTAEEKKNSIDTLLAYFAKKGVSAVNAFVDGFDIEKYYQANNPTIIFYPMPYEGIYGNYIEYANHLNKLICYTPYGIGTTAGGLFINTPLHNLAWRVYVATSIHKESSVKESYNGGENVKIVGENNFNRFRDSNVTYKWKKNGKDVKKIIWAPHYSIITGHALHRASFLWLSEFMLNIADKYEGRLQVAFKPHPKLKTLMYEHPDWGKIRTENYFNAWAKGENTLLEVGEYATLFATSDGMIHDSSSFIGEYMYTEKPVLFTSKEICSIRSECNSFGNACLDLHYHASDIDTVKKFIDDVIMGDKDTLKAQRHEFYELILSIDDELTTGQRIYNDIKKSLGWL